MGRRTRALRHATFELAILCFFPSIKANRVRFVRNDGNQSRAARDQSMVESGVTESGKNTASFFFFFFFRE